VCLKEDEGLVLPATVAAVVDGRAVDEGLLRIAIELSGGDIVSTLNSTNGGESPAGTALSLVLDGSDGSFSTPVFTS
jgi:hypothetical protein